MSDDRVRSMLTAAAWERAKGALREVVVLRGHKRLFVPPGAAAPAGGVDPTWRRLDELVEGLIAEVEGYALHE